MKQLLKFILIPTIILTSQSAKAEQNTVIETKTFKPEYCRFQNDTAFSEIYVAKSKKVYSYSSPNLNSKTKTRLPKKVILVATKKYGNFVYGEFYDYKTTKENFEGWFLLTDLLDGLIDKAQHGGHK